MRSPISIHFCKLIGRAKKIVLRYNNDILQVVELKRKGFEYEKRVSRCDECVIDHLSV
jgi:hypothetical protein